MTEVNEYEILPRMINGQVHIPLNFWFSQDPRMAIPPALVSTRIKINYEFPPSLAFRLVEKVEVENHTFTLGAPAIPPPPIDNHPEDEFTSWWFGEPEN